MAKPTLTSEMLEQHEARATIADEMGEVFTCVTPDVLRALIDAARRDMQRDPDDVPIADWVQGRGRRAITRAWGAGPGTTPLSESNATQPVGTPYGQIERSADRRVFKQQAYELVERELRAAGIVRVSLPYEGRCVLSGRADGDAYEVSEPTLLAAVEGAKKRGDR